MVEYIFLEDIQKETWGPEENKNENYFILVFYYLGNSYYRGI